MQNLGFNISVFRGVGWVPGLLDFSIRVSGRVLMVLIRFVDVVLRIIKVFRVGVWE